jgi:hypothetical protein
MTMRDNRRGPGLAVRNADALLFAADMYGVQLDQLAALLGGDRPARAAVARWRSLGYAETARLGPGPPWLWVTRAGLAACGLKYASAPPALSRLAHIRAVTAARIAKTVARTTAIMREILARTGDYGCPAADAAVPGRPPRHARALYLCSPAALSTVLRSRAELGPLAARIEVRDLPPGALS